MAAVVSRVARPLMVPSFPLSRIQGVSINIFLCCMQADTRDIYILQYLINMNTPTPTLTRHTTNKRNPQNSRKSKRIPPYPLFAPCQGSLMSVEI